MLLLVPRRAEDLLLGLLGSGEKGARGLRDPPVVLLSEKTKTFVVKLYINLLTFLIHLQFLLCQLRQIFPQDSSVLNLGEADQSQVTPARQLHQLLDDFLKHGPAFTKLSLG